MTAKRHWHEIDWLYTIGIILVIIGHSHPSDWALFRGTVLEGLIVFLYIFHMPLFFFISGFLFQNSDSVLETPLKTWLKHKALRLLVPYCFWTLIALLPKYYLEHHSLQGITPAFLFRIVFYPRENVWGHLWFIPTLFLLYVVLGALRVLLKKYPALIFFSAALLAALGARLLSPACSFLCISDACANALFFCVGILFNSLFSRGRTHELSSSAKAAFCVSGLLLLLLSLLLYRSFGSSSFSLLICFCMIGAVWSLSAFLPASKLAGWVCCHNYTLYLFSWFFQAAAMWIAVRITSHWAVISLLMFLSGVLGAVLTAIVASRLIRPNHKFLQLVFGLR